MGSPQKLGELLVESVLWWVTIAGSAPGARPLQSEAVPPPPPASGVPPPPPASGAPPTPPPPASGVPTPPPASGAPAPPASGGAPLPVPPDPPVVPHATIAQETAATENKRRIELMGSSPDEGGEKVRTPSRTASRMALRRGSSGLAHDQLCNGVAMARLRGCALAIEQDLPVAERRPQL